MNRHTFSCRHVRRSPFLLLSTSFVFAACGGSDSEAPAATTPDSSRTSIADVGFLTPESVLHDTGADIYFVTNINGGPRDRDNNGFISRVSPDGEVLDLQWVAGGTDGATLHAPKGLALRGDSLFVADIDTVRIFHRVSGAPLGGWGIEGASLLNDLATGPDGVVYVTDTGFTSGATGELDPAGTDAVYRFTETGAAEVVLRDVALRNPNGLAVSEDGIVVVAFGGNEIFRIDPAGQLTTLATADGGQLDGVVRLDDGTLFVTGWEASAVYRIAPDGTVSVEIENIDAPADLGYDATRNRLLVPTFNQNTIEIHTLR